MRSTVIVSILVTMVVLAASCDKLEDPYATIKNIEVDSTKRKVLLEDYTGIKCVNCPKAAQTAAALQALYKGQVIVMAVHAGFYSEPDQNPPYNTDFRVPEGVTWFNDFNLVYNPVGMINRTDKEGKKGISPTEWPTDIATMLTLEREAQITITADTTTAKGAVQSTITTKFFKQLAGTYQLSVCILEDSIVGWQKNNDPQVGPVPDIENYLFNDVLRAVINGTYGEQLTATVDTTQSYTKSYTYPLSTAWVPGHLSLVAFVFHCDTKEIIQVEKKHLLE